MSDTPAKKTRRLRAAPQTMRERAERTSAKPGKPSRFVQMGRAFRPLRKLGVILKPFRFIGRMLGRFLVPPYVRSSFRELRYVTWPDRRQTLQLTGAVILFSTIFGVLVAIFDYGLDKLFKQVILK